MLQIFNKSIKTKFFIVCVLISVLSFTGGCLFQSSPMNNSSEKYPNAVSGTSRFTAISSLGATGLALRDDGKIICWGLNDDGICDIPQNLTDIKSISNMNYAIKKDGTVAGWGGPQLNPVVPSNLTGVVEITKSQYWNLALKDDGTVVAWKSSFTPEFSKAASYAQLAIITNQSDLTSISGNLGLKKDGTVVIWVVDGNLQSPSLSDLSDIIAISNQGDYYAALRKDGTVVAWKLVLDTDRENAFKFAPIHVVETLTDVRTISAGGIHSFALKRDGTVVSLTDDSLESTGLTDIAEISTGGPDLALKTDGTIIAWGDNTYGQLFTPGNLSNVKSISSAYRHNIVLRNDGTIDTWGIAFNTLCCIYGHEPEGIRNVTGILANGQQNLILENNETIYGWGDWEYGPIPVKRIPHPYLSLFSGQNALFSLNKNGNLVVLSYNLTCDNISQRLDNVTDISSVNGGHTVALKKDGTVAVWGNSLFGQSDVPRNLSGVVSVSTQQNFDLALKSDGTVVGWGANMVGQTDIPKGLSDVTAIAAGEYHSLALKKDGSVVAWGQNKNGECNVPENLHDVVAISAGNGQSLALKKDGTLVAWGETVIPDWNA